ncbi:hypothetical protein ACMDB5_09535 [Flavobacterium sp. W1B]|uniref:hypothetical protein n=1 Tax=Flavobacterium sp. W1B TaxID=3394146 RepID=UPI0039BC63BB
MTLFILLKPVFPVVEYVVNYDYISKVLCVNKEKPKLHCDGKCYLMKELVKASDATNSLPSNKKSTTPVLEILFFQEINSLAIQPICFVKKQKINDDYSKQYSYLNGNSVFRPPTIFS